MVACQVPPSEALGAFEEVPDDIHRAKASNTGVPQPRINLYESEPTKIDIEHRFKLIKDPYDYEM
jgi:hypothetical protein